MTSLYELDLNILKLYVLQKWTFRSKLSKVIALQTDTQTHRQMRPNTLPRRIHLVKHVFVQPSASTNNKLYCVGNGNGQNVYWKIES